MKVSDYNYSLPAELIAQQPAPQRDHARLLVVGRADGTVRHQRFDDLPAFLHAGDLLVLNNTKVLRARLRGEKLEGGGQIEVLLAENLGGQRWRVMLRPGKRVRRGTVLSFPRPKGDPLRAVVQAKDSRGLCLLEFQDIEDIHPVLNEIGEVPLPPYIERSARADGTQDLDRYQTVFASVPGAVAAPTAGLHFSPGLLSRMEQQGVELCRVTLHVGLGTFAPVKSPTVEGHVMHAERFEISPAAAQQINAARAAGRRIVAVGTTVVRLLEHVGAWGEVEAGRGETQLFITPPFNFRVVNALITNFHLPESTLLMLVSAFADPGGCEGRSRILEIYAEAIRQRYRFYSYGDAMLLL